MNHFAHSEASKAAKTTEANLKNKIDEVEALKQQAETELRKYVFYLRLRFFFFFCWICLLLFDSPIQTSESIILHCISQHN